MFKTFFIPVFISQKLIADLSEDEFAQHREAVIATKLEAPKNLSEETTKLWRPIAENTLDFDRTKREVAALRQMTHDDLLQFFREYIRADAPHRAKLSAHVYGAAHALPSDAEVEMELKSLLPAAVDETVKNQVVVHVSNELSFRRTMPLFPSAL